MNKKTIRIIVIVVVLIILIGVGVGVYFYQNQGPAVGSIQYGKKYNLTSIKASEQFKGATMTKDSFLRFKLDHTTGEMYLKDLEACPYSPIPLIVTNYKESHKQTIIEFEYVLNQGENTRVQHLIAVSTKDKISIYADETYNVKITQQKPTDINQLKYSSLVLEFSLEQEDA